MTLTRYMCQKKKEEESSVLKIALINLYYHSMTIYKLQWKSDYRYKKLCRRHKDQQGTNMTLTGYAQDLIPHR